MNQEKFNKRIAELAKQGPSGIADILEQDYCVIAEQGENCATCGKPFLDGQEVVFYSEGRAKLIDDMGDKRFVIDQKANESFMQSVHKACY